MTIKFKSDHSIGCHKVFDGTALIGYAQRRSNEWYIAKAFIEFQEWNGNIIGPYKTRKQAGSSLRKLSNG